MRYANSGGAGRWVLPVVLVALVVGLVGTGFGLYRVANPTESPYSFGGQAIPDEKDRARAIAVAEQFSLRMDAVDGSDPEGYVEKVSELLTTKQKSTFEEQFGQFQELGVEENLRGEGTILASGVADLDADSASVLVAHDSTVTVGETTTQRHYRWRIALRKVDGDWLVDDFEPVN